MICPKCKCEYVEGYVKCSDCGIELVQNTEAKEIQPHISAKGISLVSYGIGLLFLVTLQTIAIIISYEFYWVYKLSHGGVSGTAIENVHPIIWCLIILQTIVSAKVIHWGLSKRDHINRD